MGEMVNIGAHTSVTGGSPRLTAYVTRPPGAEPLPGVVMVHEAWGLDETMKRSADHLAAMGYVVI
ncbi:MAG: dienelactone hydrolase family protein, partial [Lapillicoccus sp.]